MPEYSYTQGLTYNSEYFYKYLAEGIASAKAEDVLLGKTYIGAEGKTLNGTMPNNGALNYTPTTSQQTIPAGYTSGGTIAAVTSSIDSDIVAGNIKKDVEILGVTGTYEGAGIKTYSSETEMNNDIANIQEGEVVKVRYSVDPVYRFEMSNGLKEKSINYPNWLIWKSSNYYYFGLFSNNKLYNNNQFMCNSYITPQTTLDELVATISNHSGTTWGVSGINTDEFIASSIDILDDNDNIIFNGINYITTFYIKETTMKKLIKEEDTISSTDFQTAEEQIANLFGEGE